jgi:adenylate kinase family enzyme
MPILSVDDAPPARPRRVLVAGTSGSGKTTLAGRLGRILNLPHTEIDSLYHGPNWVPRPSFVADVERFSGAETWVTEWQYGAVRELLAERADLLAWLDLPRRTVMGQVIRRTVLRRLRREELWNGNVEPPLLNFFTFQDNIIRWAWKTHHKTAHRVQELLQRRPDLPVVRLRHHADADRWIETLSSIYPLASEPE